MEGRSGLNPGDNAPPFELPDLEGKLRKLSDFKGKVVLLNFWASWCGPCVAELPALERLYTELKSQGFEIIAIGIDDEADSLMEFKRRYSMTFPVLVDKSGILKNKYRVTGVPESFILDRDGKMLMIPDPSNNMPIVRIIGPRDWSNPNVVSRIRDLTR